MQETIVLTLIGDDRPGLIEQLSGVIAEHGGNWEQSRMTNLAGKFAGLLLVKVPKDRSDALLAALDGLTGQGAMQVLAERAGGSAPPPPVNEIQLELTGQDHPGIVHDISHALASRGISIDAFETETRAASMSGENLFVASANLQVPRSMSLETLRDALEALADELMVDINLGEED